MPPEHVLQGDDAGALLDPDQLSILLKVPKGTIYQWRHRGIGPRSIRVGRHLRYRRSDVERWLDERSIPGV